MELELLKVENGFYEGDVLFHSYIQKTQEEVEEAKRRRMNLETEKARRRQQQEENVQRKKEMQEGQKKSEDGVSAHVQGDTIDDDKEWYRREVGDEPEDTMFLKNEPETKREKYNPFFKKRKKPEAEAAQGEESGQQKKPRFKSQGTKGSGGKPFIRRTSQGLRNDRSGKSNRGKPRKPQ